MGHGNEPPAIKPATILIVEDDLILRDLLAEVIADMGAVVHTACTADEGIDAVMAHAELSLLITDVVTPGKTSGWDLAAWAREHRPELPVIVTSGFSARQSTDLPANATFLAKPWSLSEICTLVNRCLEGN
jgi:DNA-binding NtrC family response regulator